MRSVDISLRVTDTLQAAHELSISAVGAASHRARVAILNMASPLRPGGGVLSGASSQEEWLCTRTTLYPSLREEFYRLPEVGGVYTPDVLVFRSWDSAASELDKKDRFYVDVITAAMLRFPDIEGEGGEAGYAEQKDRDLVISKMRAVLRIVRSKGVDKVVLGAWGCGAYGNPVREIARAWRRVLLGARSRRDPVVKRKGLIDEGWDGLEVVFAIKDSRMAEHFAKEFGDGIVVEQSRIPSADESSIDGEEDGIECA
ncbi:putative tigr02452 family protein [Phaeoacremonium minimum UCRPA7]|uniref:Putative tigr02452 family protein n=1 Tax=Phaeoacremonium minimum (strain UCR-PA7) TaxID=1286976 RepID=R8BCD1_PHAM7|nr:putative tigr02452 family protein [Phaeoacremonium minimum UCRPA7]EON96958.1 putative tigr02452 family protein [Phaeoacremonium minimum UCRPA7]